MWAWMSTAQGWWRPEQGLPTHLQQFRGAGAPCGRRVTGRLGGGPVDIYGRVQLEQRLRVGHLGEAALSPTQPAALGATERRPARDERGDAAARAAREAACGALRAELLRSMCSLLQRFDLTATEADEEATQAGGAAASAGAVVKQESAAAAPAPRRRAGAASRL